jgi:hypothetical protein
MHVGDSLVSGQVSTYEKGTGIVSEIFRLIRPAVDEQAQVETSRHAVFVEIERGKAGGRVPAAAGASSILWVERILPVVIRNPPPLVPVGERLRPH